jgi:hypothetical protein
MNAKKILYRVVSILIITGVIIIYNLASTKIVEGAEQEQCTIDAVDVCIRIVKDNKELVKKAELENIEANKIIDSVLSGTDFKFDSEKLN